MSDFIEKLPEFPEYSDYLLTRDSNGDYLLLAFDNGGSFTIAENGTVKDSGGYHYRLSDDGNSWISSGLCGGAHPFTSDSYTPVFSTVNCYDTSGNVLYYGSSYVAPPSFIGGLSSSGLLSSFSDIFSVLPIALAVFAVIIGIRKSLSLFRGLIRGA